MTPLETLALAVSGLTALVGLFVAYQAFRGYRRNDSSRMRGLAVGIAFIAVGPFVLLHPVNAVVGFTDAQALAAGLAAHVVGLLAVYTTFD